MAANLIIPVAQYVRMSTEHQQYSLENQSTAIQNYAESHGFTVVQTYTDAARSGVVLRRRSGLRQLLKDVVGGNADYRAVLVYDVSRWGRFQDSDEAAHYEFLCKSAGVPVHYCAETFANDGTLSSLIMKALKRTMAGEYSRELSVKVFQGHKRLALLGFKQGGRAGYGLRRLLVSSEGKPKQQLNDGERKSIATDRVILVPGPANETACVREIYRMLIHEKRTVYGIARDLNRKGITYLDSSPWDYRAVYSVLTHPKYAGCHVYGQTSQKLCTRTIRIPRPQWVTRPGAFQPIIEQSIFDEAQRVLRDRTFNKSDEKLLDLLRSLLAAEGRLSLQIIKRSPHVPSPSVYRGRFGSLRRAYALIGYGLPEDFGPIDLRRRTQALREKLVIQIQGLFPEVSIIRHGGRWRSLLQLDGFPISVRTARSVKTATGILKWIVDAAPRDRDFVTLLARLTPANDEILDLYMLRDFRKLRFSLTQEDKWLTNGIRLTDLTEFCDIARRSQAALSARG
jgi:DNA invertase Pin-like site-specific DNA recombinase